MRTVIPSIAAVLLAGLGCLSARAQVPTPSGADGLGGPNAAAPSGAATTHTPGTPGASDTPGALQAGHSEASAPGTLTPSDVRRLKKEARKAASSAPAP